MDEISVLHAYSGMKNERTLKLFKYLYTNLLASLAVAKKDEADLIKGRLLQVLGIIDSIETADDSLLRIRDIMEKRQSRSKVLESFKNKLMFKK